MCIRDRLGADGRQVRPPVVFRRKGKGRGPGSRQVQSTGMRRITGVQMQGGVTRIQHRQRQMGGSYLGSHQQLDLMFRIHGNIEAMPTPVRNGEVVARHEGAIAKLQLQSFLDANL